MTKTITLTEEELFKFETITKLIGGTITSKRVREQLGLSTRQIKRLKRRVVDHGADGVVHGLRGKPGNHTTPETRVTAATDLLKEKYADFGPTFAAEKLKDIHGITLSDERVRQTRRTVPSSQTILCGDARHGTGCSLFSVLVSRG
jgi:hypothetical protein